MLTCRGRVDLTLRQSVSRITFVEGRKAGRINKIHFLTERTVTLLAWPWRTSSVRTLLQHQTTATACWTRRCCGWVRLAGWQADAQQTHSRLHQAVRQRPPGYSACGQRRLISGDMLARDTVLKLLTGEHSTWSNPNLYFCCFQIVTTIKGRCVSTHWVRERETDRRTGNEREYENKMDKEPGQMWRQISSFKIHAYTDTDSYTYKLSWPTLKLWMRECWLTKCLHRQ